MVEALFPEKGVSVLKRRFTPPFFSKIIAKELCHAVVSRLPEEAPNQILLFHCKVIEGCVERISLALVSCLRQFFNALSEVAITPQPPANSQFAIIGPSRICCNNIKSNLI